MQWNSTLYDQKHDFVAKYGEGLLTFLPEKPAQARWICREKDFFFRIFSENEAHFSASGTLF